MAIGVISLVIGVHVKNTYALESEDVVVKSTDHFLQVNRFRIKNNSIKYGDKVYLDLQYTSSKFIDSCSLWLKSIEYESSLYYPIQDFATNPYFVMQDTAVGAVFPGEYEVRAMTCFSKNQPNQYLVEKNSNLTYSDNTFVNELNDFGYIVLDKTPFYATSGGQIYDTGTITERGVLAEVTEVVKAPNKQHLMYVHVKNGSLKVGDVVTSSVDKSRRFNIMKNHSSVHLLQKTLQELLSSNVHQAGSSVTEDSFRFDFVYQGKLSDELILDVEKRVNERVNEGVDTKIETMSIEEATKKNAMALFEDKYGSVVRVVTLGDSVELCAGTHVKNTKDIKRIAILSVENKGSNTYRITGATDKFIGKMLSIEIKPYRDEITKLLEKAKKIMVDAKELGIELEFDFSVDFDELDSYKDVIDIKNNLNTLKDKVKELEKLYNEKKVLTSIKDLSAFTDSKIMIDDVNTIVAITDNYEGNILKQITDELANKYDKYFILLANTKGNNVNFICKSNYDKVNVGSVIRELSQKCLGNGGGNKNFAQGGGTDITNLGANLQDIKEYLRNL